MKFPSQQWMSQALNARVMFGPCGYLIWLGAKNWW